MNKKYFYLLLLLILTCGIHANAQTPMYFKGAGTGSNSYPFSSTLGLKTQHLYLPGDLPGAVSGNITRIYFRSVTPNVSATFTDFSFKLGQTTATQFPGAGLNFATPLTTVVTGSPYTVFSATGATDWFFVDLTTPFPFNASQSLILEVVWSTITSGGFNVRTSTGPAAPNNKRLVGTTPTATSGSSSANWMDFGIDVSSASTCAAPTGLTATGITFSGANHSWTAVTGATGYQYAVTTSSTPPATGTATTATTYNSSGLPSGTVHYLHVRTACGASFSAWTTFSFTTAACTAPTGLAATGITTTGANINWTAIPGVTGYEYSVITNSTPPASGTATTATTYNAGGLTPNTTYYVHVRTQCGTSSFSPWTTINFTTQSPSCTNPGPVSVSGITTNSANISWATIASAVGYQYAVTTNSAPPAIGINTTATVYNAPALTPGTTYYAHVRTECTVGIFSSWVTQSFTTSTPPCLVPMPAVSNITTGGADISWPAVAGAVGYEFSINGSSMPPPSGANTTLTSQPVTGLVDNTPYFLHVRTNCGTWGYSAWVTVPFATAAFCTAPTAIFSNISPTTADINWNAMASAVSYQYMLTQSITVPTTAGTGTTGLNYNAKDLVPSTKYYMHLRSICGSDVSNWSTSSFVTPAPTSVNNISAANTWTIYPNPAKDQLAIESDTEINEVRIYSALGALVLTQQLNSKNGTINTTELSAGVYVLHVSTGHGTTSQQFSILK